MADLHKLKQQNPESERFNLVVLGKRDLRGGAAENVNIVRITRRSENCLRIKSLRFGLKW